MSQKQDLTGYDLGCLYKSYREKEGKYLWWDIVDALHSHVHKHCIGHAGKRNLSIVHPYYFETDKDISYNIREQGSMVAGRIEYLVNNLDRSQFNVVLFDDETGYVSRTHKWTEKGLVDMAVINPDTEPLCFHESGGSGFKNSEENYFAGSFGDRCVREIIGDVREHASYWSIKPIRDAILYAEPVRGKSLFESAYEFVKGVTVKDILNEKPLARRIR